MINIYVLEYVNFHAAKNKVAWAYWFCGTRIPTTEEMLLAAGESPERCKLTKANKASEADIVLKKYDAVGRSETIELWKKEFSWEQGA